MKSLSGSMGFLMEEDNLLAVAVADPIEPFLLLAMAFGTMMLALFYWQRRRYRRALEVRMDEMREQMARDFHDELGSKLTVITLYGELARQALDEKKPPVLVRAYINKVLESSHQLYSSMKDLIWALNPGAGRRENLWKRLETNGHEIFSGSSTQFRIDIQEEIKGIDLAPEAGKDILLLVKEALHNARRHAESSEVNLRATLRHGALHIVIEDDGRGFDPGTPESGEGIRNMRLRARRIGGRFDLFSSEQGTRIYLSCPLPDS